VKSGETTNCKGAGEDNWRSPITSTSCHVLQRLVEETRKEKDCLSYQLYQNLDERNDFTVVEDWASNAAIDSHMVTEHVQDAKAGSRRRLKSKDTGPLDNCEQRKAR
jgi:quinol monooxygenase YgiN